MSNNASEEPTHKEEKKYVFKDPTFDVSIMIREIQIWAFFKNKQYSKNYLCANVSIIVKT